MPSTFDIATNLSKIDVNGIHGVQGGRIRNDFGMNNKEVTFVGHFTDLQVNDWFNSLEVSIDGGAFTNYTNTGFGNVVVASGLAAGNHLVRCRYNPYLRGFTLSGGSEQIVSVAKKQAYLLDNLTNGSVGLTCPSETTLIARQGAYKEDRGNTAGVSVGPYGSFVAQFGFTGSGLELVHNSNNRNYALSVDGALDVLYQFPSINAYAPYTVGTGLSNTAHTIVYHDLSYATNVYACFRALNGTRLTASVASGATTASVASATDLAVGHWVRLGTTTNRQDVKITAIAGTTVTFTPAATAAHAINEPFESYHVAQGSFNAARAASLPVPTKRCVGIGDSNTQGANPYTVTPDPTTGLIYTGYDNRASWLWRMCKARGWEDINLGIQGTDTINQASRKADIVSYARTGFDYCFLLEGTNDINSNTTTAAQYKANVLAQVDTALTGLTTTGKIVLIPPATPQGATSAKGLNLAACATALQQIAADPTYSSKVIYAAKAWNGVNLTLYNPSTNPTGEIDGGLHFLASAHQKLAANLASAVGVGLKKLRPSNLSVGIGIGI